MSAQDCIETFAVTVFGWLMIFAAFAWAGFDAAEHLGRVGLTTLFGAVALGAAGGVLVSKTRTIELFDFLFAQAARAKDIKFSVGSGDDAK